jgi:acid phosphatase
MGYNMEQNKYSFSFGIIILFFFYSTQVFAQKHYTSESQVIYKIRLENLSLLKDKIIEYHSSGQYDKDLKKICTKAWNKLKRIPVDSNSTVVFDVDETTLSNYSFLKTMDFGYLPYLWDKWVDSAKAPAIEPVKTFYDSVKTKGFKIVFITGRLSYQYDATIKNLKEQGYSYFDTLITKSDNDHFATTSLFKEHKRIDLTKKGYKIVCSIGDQYSDMYGKYNGLKVKLVNYMYFIK